MDSPQILGWGQVKDIRHLLNTNPTTVNSTAPLKKVLEKITQEFLVGQINIYQVINSYPAIDKT